MIKVIVADDELLVRVGLKSAIDWNFNGFEIVAEAANGRDALEYLLENGADILLTDIKMPIMNGIELLREIKDRDLQVRSLVLSCHDEYEYVREALKLGARDYLLKLSLSSENLLALLNELKKEIEINGVGVEYKAVNPLVLEEKWLKLLLKYDYALYEELVSLGTCLKHENIMVFVLSIDNYKSNHHISSQNSPNILKDSVVGILNSIINDYAAGDIFEIKAGKYVAVINPKTTEREYLSQIALNIQQALKRYVQLSVTIGISELQRDLSFINNAYRQAYEALSRKMFIGSESVVFHSDILKDRDKAGKVFLRLEEEESLSRAIYFSKVNKVSEFLQSFFYDMEKSSQWNNETLHRALDDILYHFSKNLKIYGKSFEDIPQYKGAAIKTQLRDIEYLSEIRQWFAAFINAYFEYIAHLKKSTQREDVTKAVEYIIENYNSELTLSRVAGHVNMSENYFSHIFKKVLGDSFTEYITKYRIEKAKELLRSSNMKINEIAQKVGFDNVYYFSNVFKKYAGASPVEYKKGLLKS